MRQLLHKLWRALLALAILLLLGVAGVCIWTFLYTGDLPDVKKLSQFNPPANSVVSDSCLAGPSTAVPFERIGEPFGNALVAVENPSSMPLRIASSLLCDHTKGNIRRGLKELRLAWHIRRQFSEQEIFVIYANRSYFGPGMIGVENASRQLFHKEPDALTIEQAALIAGLIRAPGVYSPYKYPDRALQRRNKVLELMKAQGKLGAADAARLEATPLGIQE